MPGARGWRRARPSPDEVHRHWRALSPELRRACLRFGDPALVERVKVNLAVLYERQTTLQALGLAPADEDPLEASVLLKQGFELSYGMRYAKQRVSDRVDNDVMLVDRDVSAVLTVKADFVRRDDFLDRISSVLPDFLSQKCSRQLLPRARWKGLLAAEPANVGELEQQLARLVEQALWSMVSDPALQAEQSQAPVGPPAEELELEGWMQEHDAKVKKKADKRKARRTKAGPYRTWRLGLP
ncbi:unnamed protein product [Prorocentrum cordatum]|uniref:Uncharacterized protein n=1 Tax=Prorocentrum cordatum TaxID=2364126 RepID=A0ABN9UB49_9DINO|nr:unnamed protein product [Polarella glacialis]